MTPDETLSMVVIGVLSYKSLELIVVRHKVRQTRVRDARRPSDQDTPRLGYLIRGLDDEFYLVTMSYLLSLLWVLGVFYLTVVPTMTVGEASFTGSLAVSLVTILSSIFVTVLNIAVEKYRVFLDENA